MDLYTTSCPQNLSTHTRKLNARFSFSTPGACQGIAVQRPSSLTPTYHVGDESFSWDYNPQGLVQIHKDWYTDPDIPAPWSTDCVNWEGLCLFYESVDGKLKMREMEDGKRKARFDSVGPSGCQQKNNGLWLDPESNGVENLEADERFSNCG
ncbi:hypothetical protein DFH09DRAFT_1105330 [Mycena vulgaris]|nr:hypothetical protein DFH09DRAFT_1105330 [Mycena vulgaris]